MFTIRKADKRDQQAILAVTRESGVLDEADVAVVDELLSVYLFQPDNHDYIFGVAHDESERILGYVCFGPTPVTEGTFDLYWIAVSQHAQGQGMGSALVKWAEQSMREAGGRLVVIETSTTPEYAQARRLYERRGYTGST